VKTKEPRSGQKKRWLIWMSLALLVLLMGVGVVCFFERPEAQEDGVAKITRVVPTTPKKTISPSPLPDSAVRPHVDHSSIPHLIKKRVSLVVHQKPAATKLSKETRRTTAPLDTASRDIKREQTHVSAPMTRTLQVSAVPKDSGDTKVRHALKKKPWRPMDN